VTAPLPDLVLYGKPGCHLCEDAREALNAVRQERSAAGLDTPELREADILGDPDLTERYRDWIPVLALGDRELRLVTQPARIRRLLADVIDGMGPDRA
jgi:glutaredoxin-like protein DUF836